MSLMSQCISAQQIIISMKDSIKEKIKKEIRLWSKDQLEPPNPEFNNLPVCPYAKKAWADKKVGFVFKTKLYENNIIYKFLEKWDDSKDLIIVVDMNFVEDTKEFHDNLDDINEDISENDFGDQDLWVMGFHPYQEVNELIDDGNFEGETEEEYALIFIQRLSKLEKASEKLISQGYYETYFDTYEVEQMYVLRKEYYRRLQNAWIEESRAS